MAGRCMGAASSLPSLHTQGVSCLAPTMDRVGPDPQHPNVVRLREHQSRAMEHLNRALSVDESSPTLEGKAGAVEHYRRGVQELERGVALALPAPDPQDPTLARALALRTKMEGNLATARERLTFLATSLHLNTLSLAPEHEAVPPCRPTALDTTYTVTPKPRAPASPSRAPRSNRTAELRKQSVARAGEGKGAKGARSPAAKGRGEVEGLREATRVIKGCEPKLVEAILQEVVPSGATGVRFADISGQEKAKAALEEMVVLPALRPDLFTGLRAPARGLLMFGPPGNGKTLLARALAAEASSNLINMSSSTLTSKWLGEGEKLVKALFAVARHVQPSIIFIDEIDALLSERRSGEHEGVRRIKTELLLQFEGMLTGAGERVVVVAATNRPQELDDAALRRFTKRVYVAMPDPLTRRALVGHLLARHSDHKLTEADMGRVVSLTAGYSCSDLTNLARDAALAPVRELAPAELAVVKPQDVRRIGLQDFLRSMERVRKSLSEESLKQYEEWNTSYGDVS